MEVKMKSWVSRYRFILFHILILIIPGLMTEAGKADQKNYHLLTADTFFDFETIRNPQISPDGKNIVFTRGWIDKINDQSVSNLWIVDPEASRLRELTAGNWCDYNPVWSPDGKKIAFTMFVPADKSILPVKLPRRPENAKWAAPAIIVDRFSWRADGRGYLPEGDTQVFIIDARVGGTPRQVTSGDYSHSEPEWSADNQKIYVSAIRKPEPEYQFGGSGGGLLTAWIVGHTKRFRAAVCMRPVINWHSFVGTTDFPGCHRQFKKYPWEDPVEYAERSPLNYVADVTTPTMIMTGEADLRTPIGQSEEFYRALKMLKKETLLVRMPEEYHGWRRPTHQLLQQLYLQAWFEKYRVRK